MKASLKFREDQKPLFRAKVPLSIVGLPFQSGIVAGESRELSLNLATFFESGPSIKIAYRPNDTWNPFSLVFRTGTGPYGSPFSSSMLMSAEFSLLGRGKPSFMLHFKPRFGDFHIKKSQSSSDFEKSVSCFQNGRVSSDDDSSIEVVEAPVLNGERRDEGFCGKRFVDLPQPTASAIVKALSSVEVAATTKLPMRSHAVMNFRWGVRVPTENAETGGDSTAGINFKKIPFLVMKKIGIEHVYGDDSNSKASTTLANKVGPEFGNADVADACLTVKRQLEVLQAENGLLKRAVDDLRQEIGPSKLTSPAVDWSSGKYREKVEWRSKDKKMTDAGTMNEHSNKAMNGGGGGAGEI
uniref:Uncharacterized protein MANES_04G138500 n=1 Tax=Rhizophora mucronata TaxID=61149 RepID=A0A2P2IQ47_RHIMU